MPKANKNAYDESPHILRASPNLAPYLSSPMEVSSRRPVPVLRKVVPVTKKKAIDPRFDRAFGHFNEDLFRRSYDFLADSQKRELDMLRQSLKNEADPMRREHLKKTLSRLNSMKRNKDLQEERRQIVREHRKTEAQLVEQGKTPYFLKKGDIKKLELAKQFDEYKKRTGADADIDRFIEKRRRRKASKQRKYIPWSPTENE